MGSKLNPGTYDCYEMAEDDEPMFVLLARDPVACHLVSIWSKLRLHDHEAAKKIFDDLITSHVGNAERKGLLPDTTDEKKAAEAMLCSLQMGEWIREKRPGKWIKDARPRPEDAVV